MTGFLQYDRLYRERAYAKHIFFDDLEADVQSDPYHPEPIREFDTGATRDTAEGKFEYDGFLSPYFLNEFARYMHKHRKQADGNMRASDNWQRGMPPHVYVSSAWRHFFDFWAISRGIAIEDEKGERVKIEDAVMGLVFNLQGYMHELDKDTIIKRSA